MGDSGVHLVGLGGDLGGGGKVGLGPWVDADEILLTDPVFTRRQAHNASQSLKEIGEELLPRLSTALNDIHNVSRSVRYWSIILDLSVHRLLSMTCERFRLVKEAVSQERDDIRFATLSEDCFYPPVSFDNIVALAGENDRFNWQLFSQCIHGEGIPHFEKTYSLKEGGRLTIENTEREGIWRVIDHRNRGIRSSIAYFGLRISSRRSKLKFLAYTRGKAWQVRDFPVQVQGNGFYEKPDVGKRDRIKQIQFNATGELLPRGLGGVFKHNLPAIFVEQFEQLLRQIRELIDRNGVPDLIFTGPRAHGVPFRTWVAECVRRGAQLFGVQHGSGYGDVPEDSRESHERQTADRFLTWGWRRREKDHPMPVPRFSDARSEGTQERRKGGLLWVTPGDMTYRHNKYPLWLRWYQLGGSGGFESDHSHRSDCFQSLEKRIRSETTVRFKGENPEVKERVQQIFEGGKIYSKGTLLEQARGARLVVVDHYPATSLYELIHVNVPVVLIDNIPEWYIDGAATDVLWDLEECGILHRSAESAASLINAVYSRVETWWNEPERQATVQRSRRQLARRAKSPMREYALFANKHVD
nr:LIC12162 family protein [Salinibacter ruber]